MKYKSDVGAVVIGRNEGDKLVKCLISVLSSTKNVVYVDSGSTDGSRKTAIGMNIEVVELDLSTKFTAARARNAGFELLLRNRPNIKYVQFVDGDCQVVEGWMGKAYLAFENGPGLALVCGRRREICPQCSVYNQLCDREWDTPIGDAKYCGGDFLIRASAFKEVGGFNEEMIAGEEPELCLRIRKNGWKISRLKDEMTLHDANIKRFSQWWKRNVRGGHAFAEGSYLHRDDSDHDWKSSSIRIWIWAAMIPLIVIVLAAFNPISLLLLIIYPVQVARIATKEGILSKQSWVYAFFVTLGKFPELQGQIRFIINKVMRSNSTLIEYK